MIEKLKTNIHGDVAYTRDIITKLHEVIDTINLLLRHHPKIQEDQALSKAYKDRGINIDP